MTIEETFSPVLHRINKAIRTRATHPDQGVQPPLEVLVKWTKPPQELVDRSRPQLDKLVAVSGVNKGMISLTSSPRNNLTVVRSASASPEQTSSCSRS